MAHRGLGVEAHAEQQGRAGDLRAHRALQHPGGASARVQAQLLESRIEQGGGPGDAHVGRQPTAAPLPAAMVGSRQLPIAMKPS